MAKKLIQVPTLDSGVSIDAIICFPFKTRREYIESFLRYPYEEESLKNYWREIMDTMSIKDMQDMIYDKRKEKILSEYDRKFIYRMELEIKFRQWWENTKDTREELNRKKQEVNILEVIEHYTGNIRYRKWQNIKCVLPKHNDGTASMSVNIDRNTFYCFGCHKKWTQVDFIMEMEWCSVWDAIKKFLNF